jgi:putative transposase
MPYQAYKFRLDPTISQREQLGSIAGSCRFVFNHFLAIQKDLYTQRKETGNQDIKFISYNDSAFLLTMLKKDEATSWLQLAPIQPLQQSLMDLEKATKGWLTKKSGFPKFKKRGIHDSIRFPVAPVVDQVANTVKLPKLGNIRYCKSREVTGTIKSATVSREGNHWFISILSEQPENLTPHPSNSAVGIDVGVTHFATLSTGEHIDLPKSLDLLISRTISLQQRLSHKTKGSNNRRKAQHRLSTAHRRVRNTRLDFLHKTSTVIAKNHSYVVMEDLKVTNMTRSAKGTLEQPGRNVKAKSGLNRSIAKQAWSTFRTFVGYKLNQLNGELRLVDPRHTSQTCPHCLTADKRNRKSQ